MITLEDFLKTYTGIVGIIDESELKENCKAKDVPEKYKHRYVDKISHANICLPGIDLPIPAKIDVMLMSPSKSFILNALTDLRERLEKDFVCDAEDWWIRMQTYEKALDDAVSFIKEEM